MQFKEKTNNFEETTEYSERKTHKVDETIYVIEENDVLTAFLSRVNQSITYSGWLLRCNTFIVVVVVERQITSTSSNFLTQATSERGLYFASRFTASSLN